MEEEQKKRSVPVWVWVLGCLGLLAACAVVVGLSAAAFGVFFVTSSQIESGQVAVVEAVTVEVEPEMPELVEPAATVIVEQAPTAEEPAAVDPSPEAAAEASPTADPASAAGPSAPPETDEDDPFADERAAIEANVVAIRELQPKEEVSPVSLTSDELRQRLEEDLLKDYDPEMARNDAIALSAFDFMPADFDLHSFVFDLLTEQIAGYYDPESDEFVIVSDDGDFGALEQVTHAHEYVHALQDQYYDLEQLDDDNLDSEAAFAVQALAEGEATFVQTQFMIGGYFEPGELLGLLEESLAVDTTVLDSGPPVIVRELEFPYLKGLEFVQSLYMQGGYDAVDDAWSNLPQSTEQILHPDRYLSGDVPQLVSLAPLTDTLGTGWQLADEDTLGEFYLREYLSQQLDGEAVDRAAGGWGGDRYAVYWNEGDQSQVMALKLVWDTAADADDFMELYPEYPAGLYGSASPTQAQGGSCWSGSDVICLFATGEGTLIVRAPDMETAARVAAVQGAGA